MDDESESNVEDELDELLLQLLKTRQQQKEILSETAKDISSDYTGPIIKPKGIDKDFCIELVTYFAAAHKPLPYKMAWQIIDEATKILEKEKNINEAVVPKEGRLIIIGDTHGQYKDVVALFELNGFPNEGNRYLFNGDFVDRGEYSVEILLTLYAWKIYNPDIMYLNRGNHEDSKLNDKYVFILFWMNSKLQPVSISRTSFEWIQSSSLFLFQEKKNATEPTFSNKGFIDEVLDKYNNKFYSHILASFKALPIGHIIKDKILVVHGGLPEEDQTIEQLQKIKRNFERVAHHSPFEGRSKHNLHSSFNKLRFENNSSEQVFYGATPPLMRKSLEKSQVLEVLEWNLDQMLLTNFWI